MLDCVGQIMHVSLGPQQLQGAPQGRQTGGQGGSVEAMTVMEMVTSHPLLRTAC